MTKSILDTFPYPWPNPEAQELHKALTAMYPTEQRALFVCERVDVPSSELALGQPALYLWRDILHLAANMTKTRELVEFVRKQNERHARRPFLDALLASKSAPIEAQPAGADGTPIFLTGDANVGTEEAHLFGDDLSELVGRVPALILVLTRLLTLSPAVCAMRVTTPVVASAGTAFRIGRDLLLTNHHVVFPRGQVPNAIAADFGFDTDAKDNPLASVSVTCDPKPVASSKDDDWAVVRATDPLQDAWPTIDLTKAAEPSRGERAYILQHPQGGRKRLAFVRNTVTKFTDRTVHYLSDTQQGSSGSPVLDGEGRLIALHHAGGVPQEVEGKAPLMMNEGIRIPCIVAALRKKNLL